MQPCEALPRQYKIKPLRSSSPPPIALACTSPRVHGESVAGSRIASQTSDSERYYGQRCRHYEWLHQFTSGSFSCTLLLQSPLVLYSPRKPGIRHLRAPLHIRQLARIDYLSCISSNAIVFTRTVARATPVTAVGG